MYGAFLDEPRLRFLLADDPGAGKTIMAGLYIKELMLRRAADRVLIVTPGEPAAAVAAGARRAVRDPLRPAGLRHVRRHADPEPVGCPRSGDRLPRLPQAEPVAEAFAAAEKDWDLAVVDEAHGYTLQVDAKGPSTSAASATGPASASPRRPTASSS